MKDRIILNKIKNYLVRVQRYYDLIKDLDEEEISALDQSLALTQCITNMHSLAQHVVNDEIAQRLYVFSSRGIASCRNISAHDYDSLDWERVKELCRKLLSEKTSTAISESIKIAEADERTYL
ncbi:MAG: hypothetical protein FWG87_04460 [Defluviitaleaceae bacterium]|nr:hypothetical protein [Defluviitaleaceae bacterium]